MAVRPTEPRVVVEYRGKRYAGLYTRGYRVFWQRIYLDGGTHWVKLTATNMQNAVREFKAIEAEDCPVVPSSMRVHELWAQVLARRTNSETCKPKHYWSKGTAENHELRWRLNIEPIIGNKRVQDVTARDINRIYDVMRTVPYTLSVKVGKRNRVTKKARYSEGTILNAYKTLNAIFYEAQTERFGPLRTNSPLTGADNPDAEDVNAVDADEILDWETEVEPIFTELRKVNQRDYLIVRLAAATGMRVSEILGLIWSDIDLAAGVIRLSQQLLRDATKEDAEKRVALKWDKKRNRPKTRDVILPPETAQELREFKRSEAQAGRAWRLDRFVFSTRSYEPLGRQNVRRALLRAAHKTGTKKPVGMHALRHAYASWMYAGGASDREVCEDLGHSNPDFTYKRYISVKQSAHRLARKRELHAAAGIK